MTSFTLKIIACLSMLIDHIGFAFFNRPILMTSIGRLAFPIFAYLIMEGYTHTKKIKNYLLRLFVFALISQIPYYLLFYQNHLYLNVIFSFFFSLIGLILYDDDKLIGICYILTFSIISLIIRFDYGTFVSILILAFYIFRKNKILSTISYIIIIVGYYLINIFIYNNLALLTEYIIMCLSTLLAIVPILFYNHKKGYDLKYIFYIFYPAHLIILYLIKIFI